MQAVGSLMDWNCKGKVSCFAQPQNIKMNLCKSTGLDVAFDMVHNKTRHPAHNGEKSILSLMEQLLARYKNPE